MDNQMCLTVDVESVGGSTSGLEQKVTQAFFPETINEITFWTVRALHVQRYMLGLHNQFGSEWCLNS